MTDDHSMHAFRPVPRTGVIYVTTEAVKSGFSPSDPDWCNLGQGQPETGILPGSPARVHSVSIGVDDQEYAPVGGLWEPLLRSSVAGRRHDCEAESAEPVVSDCKTAGAVQPSHCGDGQVSHLAIL